MFYKINNLLAENLFTLVKNIFYHFRFYYYFLSE